MANLVNFEWFLIAYGIVFNKEAVNLKEEVKEKIDILFARGLTPYTQFVDGIATLFELDEKQKEIFLQQERFCICCKTQYPVTYDPFRIYYDITTKEDITYSLCNTCNKFTDCSKCYYFIDGPWNIFYFNITDKTTICDFCFNNKKKPNYTKILILYNISIGKEQNKFYLLW